VKQAWIGLVGWAMLAIAVCAPASAAEKSTLETVRERGYVICGVTDRMPGFATQGEDGSWSGFNIDFCRALASAALGDASAFRAADYWIDALVAKDIDVLHAGSTWTFNRDTTEKVDFPGINFYDGQGFIAHAQLGVKTLKDAIDHKEVKICAIGPTSTAKTNLEDFMAKNTVSWQVIPVQTMDGMWRAFFGGRCNLAIHDRTALAGVHAGRLDDSADYVVFPEVISKEPLSPAVRDDDPVWRDLVTWVTYVTVTAEELGVTQANVDDLKANSTLPEVRRLLGVEPGLGKGLSVDDEWAYRVIKRVGNYREIFDRNLGADSPLKMSRGLNALWTNGGLLYAPPVR
jgi:general L-amino acid transport system substrate-binding protein